MGKPSIEDRLAIEDLLVRYTTALDEGDVEGVVDIASPKMVGSTAPSLAVTRARQACVNSRLRLLTAGGAGRSFAISSAIFVSTSPETGAALAAISSTMPPSPGSPRSSLLANLIATSGRSRPNGCSRADW